MNNNRRIRDRRERERARLIVPRRDNPPVDTRPFRTDVPTNIGKRPLNPDSPKREKVIDFGELPILSNLPRIYLPSKTQLVAYARGLTIKQRIGIVASVVVIATAGSLAGGLMTHTSADGNDPITDGKSPQYKIVLPEGKSIDDLGGWKRISPPKTDPVYAYTDKIDDVPVAVSQQPIPKSFVGDIDGQVAELAKKFNATNKIDDGDTKIYVGTSAKGPQSAILVKRNLLILIKSEKKIDNKSWAAYTKSLNYFSADPKY